MAYSWRVTINWDDGSWTRRHYNVTDPRECPESFVQLQSKVARWIESAKDSRREVESLVIERI